MSEAGNYWTAAARRRLSRRALLRSSAASAGLVGLAAAGCGGGSSTNGAKNAGNSSSNSGSTNAATSSAASAPTAASTAAAASGPATGPVAGNFKTGGTIQTVIDGPIGLDPFENSSYRSQELAAFVYSRLFKFNSGTDPKITSSREPVPDLVQSYEVSPDKLTYTLKLRQGVMFQPPLNRSLTSADVISTFERFTTDTKNTNSGVFKPFLDSITAPDGQTVVFKLKQPYAPFINKLANPQYLWIMSKDVADGKIDPAKQMVGTGPWLFDNASPTAYTFKKNPNYFLKGLPYADGAVFNIIPDTATQEAQFQAGKLDYFAAAANDVDSLRKAVPKAQLTQWLRNLLGFIFFTDVKAPDNPFSDVRLRRAVSLATDRNGLLDVAYNSKGAWSNLINPGMGKWWLDPQGKDIGSSGQWFKHDPAQAKQLLQQSGHADTQFKFIYPNNAYGDVFNSAADAQRGMLADAGFKLQVVTVDYQKDYINNGQGIFFKGAPPNSIVYALETPFTDPDDYLFGMLSPQGNRNHSKVDDAKINELLKQEQAEADENKRVQLVHQLQQLASDQMYYVPNVTGNLYEMAQSWIQNFFVADDFGFPTEALAYLSINK